MESTSQAAVYGGGARVGGKFYKRRPIAARKTPYDRPTPPQNPNWLNALVSPARVVAGGAGKLLSSLWNPESWASRSSSSESDSDSEGGIEDYYEKENLRDGDVELNQNQGSSSGKSEILYLVEQLLLLEHFSREECDRLIKIINLQVADYTMKEGMDAEPNNPNTSNKVIMEARTMITKKPVGSSVNRSYLYGGSWNIQNEIQRLHSKAMELLKPKSGNETVNMDPKDTRTTHDDAPTEALSSLPTIEEKYQIAVEKHFTDGKKGDGVNCVEGDSDMITEYAEMGDVIHASQGSSNTNDPTSTNEIDSSTVKRAATRTRRYNTRSSWGT